MFEIISMLCWFFGTVGGGLCGTALGKRAARRAAGPYVTDESVQGAQQYIRINFERTFMPFYGLIGAVVGGGLGAAYETYRRNYTIKIERKNIEAKHE